MATRLYELEIENADGTVWEIYQNDDGTLELSEFPDPAKVGDLDDTKTLLLKGASSMALYGHTKIKIKKV